MRPLNCMKSSLSSCVMIDMTFKGGII